MKIHTYGSEQAPVVIMLPGSFCNADTMADIITRLEAEFHILAVDYNGQYPGSEKPFTSRSGEANELVRYLLDHSLSSVALVYGQSMGGEIGMELLSQLKENSIAVDAAFFYGGPFLCFPKVVSKLLGRKFKTIIGNLRGKTLEEALKEPTIVKFSGGKPERYSGLLGPICRNAIYMSDETLEREADACVTFDFPGIDRDLQNSLYFFYSREESAWRFCHRKLQKAYPHAHYRLVSGYGHVGYPGEHPEEYCGWLSALARGEKPEDFLPESNGTDDKQKSKEYFNSHSSTIVNRNGYWSYDYRITSKYLMRQNVRRLMNWWFTKWPTGDHAVYSRAEMEKMLREAGFEHIHSRLITPFTYVCTGRKPGSK